MKIKNLQALEDEAMRAKPQPSSEVESPSVVFPYPPAERISKQAAVNGGDPGVAINSIIGTARWKLATVELLDPPAAARIKDLSENLQDSAREFYKQVDESFHRIKAIEQAALDSASHLKTAADIREEIARAVSILDTEAALDFSGGELMELSAKRKHLPARAEAAETAARDATTAARALAAEAGLDVSKIVRAFLDEARRPGEARMDIIGLEDAGHFNAFAARRGDAERGSP